MGLKVKADCSEPKIESVFIGWELHVFDLGDLSVTQYIYILEQ